MILNVAETHVDRCETLKPIPNREQNSAFKELKRNPNIVIGKSDKSTIFVKFFIELLKIGPKS